MALSQSTTRSDEMTGLERRAKHARIRSVLAAGTTKIAFQPIVNLDSGRRVGYEALARFSDLPGYPPEDWLADAATVGLQTELELVAIKSALESMNDLEPEAFLAINLGPSALLSQEVRDVVLDSSPDRIVIEITEHVQISNYDALNDSLVDLRKAGVQIAIDDAGAGFASLRHVLQLTPDIIKIDRSLTADLGLRAARAAAAALISFATEMGQIVIAEGIETAEMVDMLGELGVRLGQGFFLGAPGALPGIHGRRSI